MKYQEMSANTVELDPETYDMLRKQRRASKTSRDAVRRPTGPPRSILDFAGVWKDVPEDDLARITSLFAEGRRRDKERMEKLMGRWS